MQFRLPFSRFSLPDQATLCLCAGRLELRFACAISRIADVEQLWNPHVATWKNPLGANPDRIVELEQEIHAAFARATVTKAQTVF